MVAIRLQNFGGMIPAVDAKLLPENASSNAVNAWMPEGKLTGLRVPRQIYTLQNVGTRSVFRIPKAQPDVVHIEDSWWLEFLAANTTCVPNPNSAPGSIDPGYYFADGVNPVGYTTLSRVSAGDPNLVLGIPNPTVAPTLSIAGGSGSPEARAYIYTWVSAYGEEGPPSPASIVTTGLNDATWTVGLTVPSGGEMANRDLVSTNIYRTVTNVQGVATYFFVANVSIATTTYADSALSVDIVNNNELTSLLYTAPTLLQGLVTMPNGILVGWIRNDLWFSQPFLPHAWPASYQISVPYPIVGLAVYGQTLCVLTEGLPYQCTGSDPSVMTLAQIPFPYPCTSQGSIVTSASGIYYAAPNGIALITPGGGGLATTKLLTKEKWQKYLTVRSLNAALIGSMYYTFSGVGEGCFEPTAFENSAFETEDFTGTKNGALIDLTDQRIAMSLLQYATPTYNVLTDVWTDEVLIIQNGMVLMVDITDAAVPGNYSWRSKIFQLPKIGNLGACKIFYVLPPGVDNPSATLTVYADGINRAVITLPTSGQMFRLPTGFTADTYQFEIDGNLWIQNVQIASSPKELATV